MPGLGDIGSFLGSAQGQALGTGLMGLAQQGRSLLGNLGNIGAQGRYMEEYGGLQQSVMDTFNYYAPQLLAAQQAQAGAQYGQFYNPLNPTGTGGVGTQVGAQAFGVQPSQFDASQFQIPSINQQPAEDPGWYPGRILGSLTEQAPGGILGSILAGQWHPGQRLGEFTGLFGGGGDGGLNYQGPGTTGALGTTVSPGEQIPMKAGEEGRAPAETFNIGQFMMEEYQRREQEAMADLTTSGAQTIADLEARYGRGMETLEGMGAQERADIGQAYKELGAGQMQDMYGRGLRGSSVAATMGMGLQREETAEMGRLDERLREQRLGWEAGLSGDVINAQQMLDAQRVQARAGLQQDIIGELGQQRGELMGTTQALGQGEIGMLQYLLNSGLGYQIGLTEPMINALRDVNMGFGNEALNAQIAAISGAGVGGQDYARAMRDAASQAGWMGLGGAGIGAAGTIGAGALIASALTGGGAAAAGGAASVLSDRNAKKNIVPVDCKDTLKRLASIDISRWTYKDDPEDVPHVGPMAQDFHKAFRLGDSDKYIYVTDLGGVALAAIQGLNQRVEELIERVKDLEHESVEAAVPAAGGG